MITATSNDPFAIRLEAFNERLIRIHGNYIYEIKGIRAPDLNSSTIGSKDKYV